jgi:hypothetical protein
MWGWKCSGLLGSAGAASQLRVSTASLAPQRLAHRWAARTWHREPVRRGYALTAGRTRRKGGAKRASADPVPSTQDARIRSPPRNSLGTNFSGQAPVAAAALPDAFQTAEHALQTLHRVYAGIKDMEGSNDGMVVVSLPALRPGALSAISAAAPCEVSNGWCGS